MAISVRQLLPAIPVPAYQALSAAQVVSPGYTIQRTAPVVLVELTENLPAGPDGIAVLPSSPRNGDEVTVVRNADGAGVLMVNAQALRYRGDAVTFQRNASAWVLVRPSKGVITTADFASEGYTDINLTGGPRSIDLALDKRFIRLTADPLDSDLTLTLPTTGVVNGEWRSFFRVGGGASFRAIITPVGASSFVLRGKREMVTLVWDADLLNGGLNPRWQEYYVDRNLFLATESGTTVVYSVVTHSGAWVYLTNTGNITVQFSSNLPTPSELIFIVRPHTVARTITLARAASPNDFATFEATGIVAPANTTVTLIVPANAAYSFRTKVVSNLGNAAVVYVVEQGSIGGVGDGTITAAKFAVELPVLVTGPLTTTLAHHRRTLEVAMSSSAAVTLAQLGAGVEYDIHRPWDQPQVALVPPHATGVYLEPLGFNGIARGGTVRVRQNNSNRPKLAGDVVWRGRPTVAEFPGLIDFADLRAGVGLDVTTPGSAVGSWASTGIGTATWTQATAANKPTLNADGSVRFTHSGANPSRMTIAKTTFSGNVLAIMYAYRNFLTGATLPGRIMTWVADATSTYLKFTVQSSTNDRMYYRNGGATDNTIGTNFIAAQEYRVIVYLLDRTNSRFYRMSTSTSTTASELYTPSSPTAANIPDWTAWNVTTANNRIGAEAAFNGVIDLYGLSIFETASAAIVNATTPNVDFMIRLLGMGRGLFPLGVDG